MARYEALNWLNKGETGAIPVNKTNLEHMDEGLVALDEALGTAEANIKTAQENIDTANNEISDLKEKTNAIIIFKRYGQAVSVPANSTVSVALGDITVPNGYTFAGIIPDSAGVGDQWQATFSNYGNKVQAYVKSYYGAELTATVTCRVMYVKTELATFNE